MNNAGTLKDMQYGFLSSREESVSKFVPYTRHIDPFTIRLKNGYLLQVIQCDGLPFETINQSDLNYHKDLRANMLRGIFSPNFAMYHHIIRREVQQTIDGFFENDWLRDLDNAYQTRLKTKRMFINEQYISLIYKPSVGTIGFLDKLFRTASSKIDQSQYLKNLSNDQKAINEASASLLATLEDYNPRLLGIYSKEDGGQYSSAVSFLSYLINGEFSEHKLTKSDLSYSIPRKRISFGQEALEIRGAAPDDLKYGAVLSIKDYSEGTGPGMLDSLLRLPHEFIVTQSFACVDRQSALNKMRDVKRKLIAGEEGGFSLEETLDNAIDTAASGVSVFGYHHLSVTALSKTPEDLTYSLRDCMNAFTSMGLIAVREDLNLEPAFWAQLPGNLSYIARKSMISAQNFSGFASLHNFPAGQKDKIHWGSPISILETTSGTPYYFNFHERDVGNFTLFGPSGTGKTVLLTFLHAQSQRLAPKSFFFDKDRGAEIYIRAVEGQYSVINGGTPSGLNPLQLEDTTENRSFLRTWLELLIKADNDKPLSPQEKEIIADAVSANYDVPVYERQLSKIYKLLGGFETGNDYSLTARLKTWHGNGDRAWLFDNAEDTLSLANRTIGFDMTSILDDSISRTPWLYYIFHRIKQSLNGEKTIIMLDEAWKLLDDPLFAAEIKDWMKTIRKMNGLVGFATQNTSDALSSSVGDAIIEQAPTQIFLPNPKARLEDYCGGFGVTKRELEIIRKLGPTSRCFLIKHGTESVIAKLDLSGMDDFITVLSGRTETILKLDRLRAEHGDDPAHWMKHLIPPSSSPQQKRKAA